MTICASCGLLLTGGAELCTHHSMIQNDDWSVSNRAACNFIHRKLIQEDTEKDIQDRLDFWAHIDLATPAEDEALRQVPSVPSDSE